tara:strand:- start:11276 stop:11647 length:372 start_codon:yes stop_codon:yes gene_type:complete
MKKQDKIAYIEGVLELAEPLVHKAGMRKGIFVLPEHWKEVTIKLINDFYTWTVALETEVYEPLRSTRALVGEDVWNRYALMGVGDVREIALWNAVVRETQAFFRNPRPDIFKKTVVKTNRVKS